MAKALSPQELLKRRIVVATLREVAVDSSQAMGGLERTGVNPRMSLAQQGKSIMRSPGDRRGRPMIGFQPRGAKTLKQTYNIGNGFARLPGGR